MKKFLIAGEYSFKYKMKKKNFPKLKRHFIWQVFHLLTKYWQVNWAGVD